jgi:hypothetical protein
VLITYICVGILALILLAGVIAPRNLSYAKTVQIQASRAVVWNRISTLRALDEWNPWTAKDPNMEQQFTGEDGSVGSQMHWHSKVRGVGEGRQEIRQVIPHERVNMDIEFIKPRTGLSQGVVSMEGTDGAVDVTWSFESTMPFPFNAMLLIINFEKAMDKDFGQGLGKLKALCEADQ